MGDARSVEEVLSFDQVVDLLQILDGSDLPTTVVYRNGPLKIRIERGTREAPPAAAPPAASAAAGPAAAPPAAGPAAPPPVTAAPEPVTAPDGGPTAEEVRAPIAGVFYRAPRPDADPYVEVGTHVEEDTVIGIVEVMKLMNTVRAGVAGTVTEICAANAELVEFHQTLVRVRPDGAGA